MLLIDSGTVPVLVNVIACAALVAPTSWAAKVSGEAGVSTSAGAVPVPFRVMFLVPSALTTASLPVLVPTAFGWNTTSIVQLAPAARAAPQLFVWAKFAKFFHKSMPILVIVTGTVPVLVNVIVCTGLVVPTIWAAKVSGEAGVSTSAGAVPVPFKAMVCVPAASTTVKLDVLAPTAFGLNATSIVQLAPIGKLVPQVDECAKL